MRFVSSLAVALLLPAAAPAQPAVRVELLELRTGNPDTWERMHRESDSRPLTLAELEKLTAAGIGRQTLVEMMRTRKVLALADADALLRLKAAGAPDAVIAAISAYAWPPNDGFDLRVQVDLATPYGVRQAPFVYVEVWHTGLDRQEAFLHADLRGLVARGGGVEVVRDRSDPLLPATVRTVRLHGRVPSRHAGALEVRALVTQKAGLRTLRDLPAADQARVQRATLEYPAVSLESRCRLDLLVDRDAMLADAYTLRRSDLECRWD